MIEKSFSFKRNIIFRIQGVSFEPDLEMQMRSCGGAAAAANYRDGIAGLHDVAFMMEK